MDPVDPLPAEIGERRKVPFRRQPARLEAPYLARRCRRTGSRLAADDPAHRRIVAQAFGVVDIFVSPPEHRLPQQYDQGMAPFLPVRVSASMPPAIRLRPRASSSSR
jgi:hypothetical protein